MKLTKYGHACVVLEEQGKKLIIDPGEFTEEFGEPDNIVAVVITHVHGDHWSAKHLQAIFAANPQAKLFAPSEAAEAAGHAAVAGMEDGQQAAAGPFTLAFFGKLHAEIHPSVPRPQNIGVLVNGTFYYPGDSFTQPGQAVAVLAVPASAPWLKISEAIDFVRAVKPKRCFRTHDGLLSERGLATTDKWLSFAVEPLQSTYSALQPGTSIEV